MTARDIIQAAQAQGVTLALHGPERIRVMPPGVLPSDLRQAIREHREELLTLLEAFEERAAIAAYCAGLPRAEAETLAWACVLDEQGHSGCPACGIQDTAGATP
jgi:TubC N-terminal docking domain